MTALMMVLFLRRPPYAATCRQMAEHLHLPCNSLYVNAKRMSRTGVLVAADGKADSMRPGPPGTLWALPPQGIDPRWLRDQIAIYRRRIEDGPCSWLLDFGGGAAPAPTGEVPLATVKRRRGQPRRKTDKSPLRRG